VCMLLSRHQNAEQSHGTKIPNRSFQNVAELKYLGKTITNQNLIWKEFESAVDSGNACYHSVQKLLSFCLLLKKLKITMCKTIIFLTVLNWCETRSLILMEEHELGVFENRCS
jgi:hypothetical protein